MLITRGGQGLSVTSTPSRRFSIVRNPVNNTSQNKQRCSLNACDTLIINLVIATCSDNLADQGYGSLGNAFPAVQAKPEATYTLNPKAANIDSAMPK